MHGCQRATSTWGLDALEMACVGPMAESFLVEDVRKFGIPAPVEVQDLMRKIELDRTHI